MTEREKEILTKAADVLFSMSCRIDSKAEERRFQRLAESLEQVVEDYSD